MNGSLTLKKKVSSGENKETSFEVVEAENIPNIEKGALLTPKNVDCFKAFDWVEISYV